MNRSSSRAVVLLIAAFAFAGCETAPKTPEAKQALSSDARASLDRMYNTDPGVRNLVNQAYGYAIFPSVGKGGFIAGGAYGRGEVYEQSNLIGYADLSQGTVGLQAGGQEYSELILFETPDALNRFKSGNFAFSANASAVALKAGASGAARFENGILVFTQPKGGLMFEASVGGQKFSFEPVGHPSTQPTR
jgi:lipid-binding SYLF domain-containing protein